MSATKILSRAANYTSYEWLRMYVHGDTVKAEYAQGDSSEMGSLCALAPIAPTTTGYKSNFSRLGGWALWVGWQQGRR